MRLLWKVENSNNLIRTAPIQVNQETNVHHTAIVYPAVIVTADFSNPSSAGQSEWLGASTIISNKGYEIEDGMLIPAFNVLWTCLDYS